MLKSVADILLALQKYEQKELEEQSISHGPTIGAMYEGLSRSILGEMVPDTLNLKLVQGFASGPGESLSRQIDCMLVHGEGRRIPYTESFVWPVRNVLAAFEVKKTLYASELRTSHDTLASVLTQFEASAADGVNDQSAAIRFAELMGRVPTPDVADQATLTYFAHSYHAPLRIVFAYDGYSTEGGLRDGFMKYFREFIWPQRPIFIPYQFPNLIVCGENTIVRYNGHPYLRPANERGVWPLLATSAANPLHFIIETLWYRFATDFAWPYPFDAHLSQGRTTPLLTARFFTADDGLLGVRYGEVKTSSDELSRKELGWEPMRLTREQWLLLRVVQIQGVIESDDARLKTWCKVNRIKLTQAKQTLTNERLIVEAEGKLTCFREKLYSTVVNGRLLTSLEQDRWRLDALAGKLQSATTEARIRTTKLLRELERGVESWHEVSGEAQKEGNIGLGRIRISF